MQKNRGAERRDTEKHMKLKKGDSFFPKIGADYSLTLRDVSRVNMCSYTLPYTVLYSVHVKIAITWRGATRKNGCYFLCVEVRPQNMSIYPQLWYIRSMLHIIVLLFFSFITFDSFPMYVFYWFWFFSAQCLLSFQFDISLCPAHTTIATTT